MICRVQLDTRCPHLPYKRHFRSHCVHPASLGILATHLQRETKEYGLHALRNETRAGSHLDNFQQCRPRGKLNGAVLSPAPPWGDVLSIYPSSSKCWQFGPLTDSKLVFPSGKKSPNSLHMKIIKNASSLQHLYIGRTIVLRGWTFRDVITNYISVRLQVMATISGLDGHFSEKSRKYQWFTRLVLGMERLFGHNLHQ